MSIAQVKDKEIKGEQIKEESESSSKELNYPILKW